MNVLHGISDVEPSPEVFNLLCQNQPEDSLTYGRYSLMKCVS